MAEPHAEPPSAFDAPPPAIPFSRDFTRPRDEDGVERPAGTAADDRPAGSAGQRRPPDTTGATSRDRPPDTTGATAAFDWGPADPSEDQTGAWTVLDPDD